MAIVVYGIADCNNTHHDAGCGTERGAKNFATRNGFTIVTMRVGYHSYWVAEKVNGKWLPINRELDLKGKHYWSESAKQRYDHCN